MVWNEKVSGARCPGLNVLVHSLMGGDRALSNPPVPDQLLMSSWTESAGSVLLKHSLGCWSFRRRGRESLNLALDILQVRMWAVQPVGQRHLPAAPNPTLCGPCRPCQGVTVYLGDGRSFASCSQPLGPPAYEAWRGQSYFSYKMPAISWLLQHIPCHAMLSLRALALLRALGPGASQVMLDQPLHRGPWCCPQHPGSAGGLCGRVMRCPLMRHVQDLGSLSGKGEDTVLRPGCSWWVAVRVTEPPPGAATSFSLRSPVCTGCHQLISVCGRGHGPSSTYSLTGQEAVTHVC